MIKVIKKGLPPQQLECRNCRSILEYNKDDLVCETKTLEIIKKLYIKKQHEYYIRCPVCDCVIYLECSIVTEEI